VFNQGGGQMRNIEADPFSIQALRDRDGCPATAEGVKDDIALV
jgi:hypothetical protein